MAIPFEDKTAASDPSQLLAPGGRVTKAQLEARLAVVAEMHFVRLMDRSVVERELGALWKVDGRTIRRYLGILYKRAARRRFEHPEQVEIGSERLRNALVDVYNRAVDAKDFRAAVAALDRLGRLEGLLGINVNISGRMAHAHLHRHQNAPAELQAAAELSALSDEDLHAYRRITEKLVLSAAATGHAAGAAGARGEQAGSGEGEG